MGKGISKPNWMWGIFGVAACSMLSFSSSAYAGTAFSNAAKYNSHCAVAFPSRAL